MLEEVVETAPLQSSHQVFCRDAAVGAADVENLGVLTLSELLEVLRVFRRLLRDPVAVVLEDAFERQGLAHAGAA
jgi:hypothetical protein